jgi:tetratricopeptide (TPR) repeat protein
MLRASGDARGALSALDAALERRPKYAWALATKGAALRDLGFLPEAIATLERAGRLSPNDWFALLMLGRSLSEAGLFEEALPPLNGAIQTSNHLWAWALKGWALHNLGAECAEEALAAYQHAIGLGDEPVWCRRGVADVLMILGNTEDSLREYRTVIEAAGDAATLGADDLASVGWCYYAIGDPDTAVSVYKEALYRGPGAVPTEFDLFLALVCAGRTSHAVRQFERAHTHVDLIEPLRRRGVLEVVAIDMEEADRFGRVARPCRSGFAEARETVERELLQTREQAAAKLNQIRDELANADVDAAVSSPITVA